MVKTLGNPCIEARKERIEKLWFKLRENTIDANTIPDDRFGHILLAFQFETGVTYKKTKEYLRILEEVHAIDYSPNGQIQVSRTFDIGRLES
jgi:hypothetical protein